MTTNLTCRCGLKIPVTKEQANSTVQCRSCLNRIHVPSEKVLGDLSALHRDIGIRVIGFLVIGLLAVAAIVVGVYTQTQRDRLAVDARRVVDAEKSDTYGLLSHINRLKRSGKPDKDPVVQQLNSNLQKLLALPQDTEEIKKLGLQDVRTRLAEIDDQYRSDATKHWLAEADRADLFQNILYAFVVAAGVVFLFLIIISARLSTHRHHIVAYEKQTHTKVISR
jgi:hypothetical protein